MPANLDDVDRRLTKLEANVASMVTSLNRMNADTHDHIVAMEKSVGKLETRADSLVSNLNKINASNHDHIVSLERKFAKLEKGTAKIAKVADPRKSEKNLMELVDKALAAYDKKRT